MIPCMIFMIFLFTQSRRNVLLYNLSDYYFVNLTQMMEPGLRHKYWSQIRNKQLTSMMQKMRALKFETDLPKKKHIQRMYEYHECKLCQNPESYCHIFKIDGQFIEQHKKYKEPSYLQQYQDLFDCLKYYGKFCKEHQSEVVDIASSFFEKFPAAIPEFFNRTMIWEQIPLQNIFRYLEIFFRLCYNFSSNNQITNIWNPLLQNALSHQILTGGLFNICEDKTTQQFTITAIKQTLFELRYQLARLFPKTLISLYSSRQYLEIAEKALVFNGGALEQIDFWIQITQKLMFNGGFAYQMISTGGIAEQNIKDSVMIIVDTKIIDCCLLSKISPSQFIKILNILKIGSEIVSPLYYYDETHKILNFLNKYIQNTSSPLPQSAINQFTIFFQQYLRNHPKTSNLPQISFHYDFLQRIIIIEQSSTNMEIEDNAYFYDHDYRYRDDDSI